MLFSIYIQLLLSPIEELSCVSKDKVPSEKNNQLQFWSLHHERLVSLAFNSASSQTEKVSGFENHQTNLLPNYSTSKRMISRNTDICKRRKKITFSYLHPRVVEATSSIMHFSQMTVGGIYHLMTPISIGKGWL